MDEITTFSLDEPGKMSEAESKAKISEDIGQFTSNHSGFFR